MLPQATVPVLIKASSWGRVDSLDFALLKATTFLIQDMKDEAHIK